MTAYLENSAVGTGLEKVSFNSNPKEGQRQRIFRLPRNCTHLYASKKGNAKEYSDYHAIVLIYMLVRLYSKFFKLGFSSTWTESFQIKLGAEKAEELEIKLPTFLGLEKKQGNFRKKIYFCFIHCSKAFDYVDYDNLWKILKVMGLPSPYLSPEKPACQWGSYC